jgi:intracellular sulfur oxidation DsrE/DsrF family protein
LAGRNELEDWRSFLPFQGQRTPMSTQNGIVIHITSGEREDWEMALRNILNLARDESLPTPADTMRVVVNGEAVKFLLETATGAPEVVEMAEAGVRLQRKGHAYLKLP